MKQNANSIGMTHIFDQKSPKVENEKNMKKIIEEG